MLYGKKLYGNRQKHEFEVYKITPTSKDLITITAHKTEAMMMLKYLKQDADIDTSYQVITIPKRRPNESKRDISNT